MNLARPAVTLLLLGAFAAAQVDTGTLTGTIKDTSGSVLPGATVSLRNEGTGQVVKVPTNEEGLYVSPPLRPGEYTVTVDATGFDSAAKRVPLDVSQRAVVDFELTLGSVRQAVEVHAVAPVLQSETSTLSNLRSEKAIKELPLNGRNFAQLIGLAAGVMPAQTQQSGSPITMKRGVTGNAVNGLRLEENNFLVDGINNNENHNGLGILIFPPLDAIEEFRVESSVADAQFGRGGGGTVNLTYKSGTRDFHGDLFEFFRNSKLDAKNFLDSPTAGIPPYKQNQFGGVLGGRLLPWIKDSKTFFFADYEGARVRQAQTIVSSVPTAAFRAGDFSTAPQRIYDPLTQRAAGASFSRDPFPGNVIPANRIDPVGHNLLSLFPAPNLGFGIANNYLFNPVRATTGDSFDIKVDHNFSASDTGFARYSHGGNDLDEPSNLPAPAVGNGPGVPGLTSQPVNQAVLSETHIFSPNKVGQARFGFTRLNLESFDLNFGKYVSSGIGVPGGNVPGDILTSGLSIFTITGLRDLGDNGFYPAIIVSENYQWSDNFSYVRGGHSLKIGGEFQRRRYNAFQSNVLRGTMAFGTNYTFNPAAPQNTGIGTADTLLGRPGSGSIRFLNGTRGFRRSEYAFYAQDDYKVSTRLTLNMGLRYENFAGWPWTEVNHRQYQFIAETQDLARAGAGRVPDRSGIHPDNNNVSPRIGLAYKLANQTVLRAGYGIFYSAPQLDITRNLASNPPEFIVSAFSNDQFNFTAARPASLGFDRPAAGTLDGAAINAIDVYSRSPYVQQWNLSLQQQLLQSIGLTIAYAGTKGSKLEARPDINRPVPGTSSIQSRRPFPRFQGISSSENRDSSTYHALQVTAERRFAGGLSFLLAYTYSHAIDDSSGDFGSPMDIRNWRLDRGNADFDVRQRLVASWAYELPFRTHGPLNHAIGGWQINGILSLYDGLPFSVNSANNSLNIGSGSRADRLRSGDLPTSQRTLQRWFDIDAFRDPGPQLFGNAGRNILRGPGTGQLDFSAFKNLPLGAEPARRLQFRAEFFNLTNTPQFNTPNATVGAPGAGTVSSAGSPLTLQRTSRQIQFALKLYF